MAEAALALLELNVLNVSVLSLLVPHQANRRIIMSAADRVGLKEDRIIINIDEFGNTTAGTISLALESARQQGRLKKGDLILLCAVCGGFTTWACLFCLAFL